MAYEWVPMRIDLAEDEAVAIIAAETGLSADAVAGKLIKVWGWFYKNTRAWKARVTEAFIDGLAGTEKFAAGMKKARWLLEAKIDGFSGLAIPRPRDLIPETAKGRKLSADRQRRWRENQKRYGVTQGSVTECVTGALRATPTDRTEQNSRQTEQSLSVKTCPDNTEKTLPTDCLSVQTPDQAVALLTKAGFDARTAGLLVIKAKGDTGRVRDVVESALALKHFRRLKKRATGYIRSMIEHPEWGLPAELEEWRVLKGRAQ